MSVQQDLFGGAAAEPAVVGEATISPCERYRYRLTRPLGGGPTCLFVMLNPSTADAKKNDKTVTRCIGFAERENCGLLEVVNLFAWRATDPRELKRAADPVGPENDTAIVAAAGRAKLVIAAWGGSIPATLRTRPAAVLEMLARLGPVWCLGKTKDGTPAHPLYLRADAPLELLHEGPDAEPSSQGRYRGADEEP